MVPERRVPIYLVLEAVPRHAANRYAVLTEADNICPRFPHPANGVRLFLIRLRLHNGQVVALVILTRNLSVSEHFAGMLEPTILEQVLVLGIVVVAHYAVLSKVLRAEELVLLLRH